MKKRICGALLCAVWLTVFGQPGEKETILFDYDSYELNPNAQDQLNQFISEINEEDVKSVKIIGHTDSDGSLSYNETLSQNRAKKILSSFEKTGIDPSKISVDFNGEVAPVASNENDEGKQSNRRVEILIEYFNFKIPEAFKVKPMRYRVHPSYDTLLQIGDRGTEMTIYKNSFVDSQGKLIKDTVDILFTEYTNAAEIMFSEIPMTYNDKGEEKVMSSGGMFDIQGEFEGKSIQFAEDKALKLDYQMVSADTNMQFFELKENNQWAVSNSFWMDVRDTIFYMEYLQRGYWRDIDISTRRYNAILQRAHKREIPFNNKYDRKKRRIDKINNYNRWLRKTQMLQDKFQTKFHRKQYFGRFVSCDSIDTYAYEGGYYEDPAPDMMEDLKIEKFGKYNCDLINRLPNKAKIIANYVDENGVKIKEPAFLSLVDPHYNGALSFYNPTRFTCNKRARNTLALFTKEGKLYVCDPNDFKAMKIPGSGSYTFELKDMTEEITNTEDLAAYLGIKY